MSKGILLFCFDTEQTKYHKILEKSVGLIKKHLALPITVVTNFATFKQLKPLGWIDYKFIEPELGNTKGGKPWNNADRHMAYEISPYESTLVMDIDYFCFSDNLLQMFDTKYDFLVTDRAYDLSGRNSFDHRRFSMIPMVWATVLMFKKNEKVKKIFDMVKYVKKFYPYFNDLYRIASNNLRNDYVFAIALQQINGFTGYAKFPFALATLPPDCKVVKMEEDGIAWTYDGKVDYIEGHDVHVLRKEIDYV